MRKYPLVDLPFRHLDRGCAGARCHWQRQDEQKGPSPTHGLEGACKSPGSPHGSREQWTTAIGCAAELAARHRRPLSPWGTRVSLRHDSLLRAVVEQLKGGPDVHVGSRSHGGIMVIAAGGRFGGVCTDQAGDSSRCVALTIWHKERACVSAAKAFLLGSDELFLEALSQLGTGTEAAGPGWFSQGLCNPIPKCPATSFSSYTGPDFCRRCFLTIMQTCQIESNTL